MMKMESLKHFKEQLIHTMTVRDQIALTDIYQKGIRWWSNKDEDDKMSYAKTNRFIYENVSIDFDEYGKKESVVNHFVPIQYRHDYYQEDKYTIKNVLAFIEEFSITASEKRIGNFKNMQNDYTKKKWSKMSLVNERVIGRIDYEEDEEE